MAWTKFARFVGSTEILPRRPRHGNRNIAAAIWLCSARRLRLSQPSPALVDRRPHQINPPRTARSDFRPDPAAAGHLRRHRPILAKANEEDVLTAASDVDRCRRRLERRR
jgi:hypothetical protein